MLIGVLKDGFKQLLSGTGKSGAEELLHGENSTSSTAGVRKVLNVGGNSKNIPIPDVYRGWQHDLLDIDPRGNPDVVCDARLLTQLPAAQYDAVYCSHNLEHYYQHDVVKVLAGFRHVLKDDGFVQIIVPDMAAVLKRMVDGGLDIDDELYVSRSGPIRVVDVIYGYAVEIERSGNDFFAHKTGFTEKSLVARLNGSGFSAVITAFGELEIMALAFKNAPIQYACE
ncbi:MAG TPA: methyltransferase domain-containing protein, partial [Burkholderiaceae bacterium]|nr:methyltransferase domain-containing protein [Burkholderiaceae bacterium]